MQTPQTGGLKHFSRGEGSKTEGESESELHSAMLQELREVAGTYGWSAIVYVAPEDKCFQVTHKPVPCHLKVKEGFILLLKQGIYFFKVVVGNFCHVKL